jgi:hypothetical protein
MFCFTTVYAAAVVQHTGDGDAGQVFYRQGKIPQGSAGLNAPPVDASVKFYVYREPPSQGKAQIGKSPGARHTVDNGTDRHPFAQKEGTIAFQFTGTDKRVRDKNIGDPSAGHNFGLAEFGAGDAFAAQLQLQPGKKKGFVGFNMRTVADAQGFQFGKGVLDVPFRGIKIKPYRRG